MKENYKITISLGCVFLFIGVVFTGIITYSLNNPAPPREDPIKLEGRIEDIEVVHYFGTADYIITVEGKEYNLDKFYYRNDVQENVYLKINIGDNITIHQSGKTIVNGIEIDIWSDD